MALARPHEATRPAALGLALALAAAATCGAHAEGDARFLVRGLADVEGWKTDDGSALLSRRDGHAALGLRLRLWTAVNLGGGFQAVASGVAEGGTAEDEGTYAELEQAFLRWSPRGGIPVVIDAGKVALPLGNFSKRYFSDVNPLIGTPDTFDATYPVGIVASARAGLFDFRVAALNKPVSNEKYVPPGDSALRPAVTVGVTPIVGLRFGAYYTEGPYLGQGVTPFLPAGAGWRDYHEAIAGAELEFSRGYFELNGDASWSRYDVPTKDVASRGAAWFLEPKYTWTPRFFTALRLERNDYPYIAPVAPSVWVAANAAFYDLEIGAGWRLTPGLLAKASYRRDRWEVDPSLRPFLPDGYAVAAQLSWAFDVRSWFERPE